MHVLLPAEVIRLPVRARPRVVAGPADEVVLASGIRGGNGRSTRALGVVLGSKPAGGLTVLDRLLEDGTLDPHQHAAALAYETLRRRYERSGGPFRSWRDRSGMSDEIWQAAKRDHARMIRAAGAERFVLDRLVLDDDAPLSSEVERVRAALERVTEVAGMEGCGERTPSIHAFANSTRAPACVACNKGL